MKPRTDARWPSWKIHTIAPNVAVRLSRLRTTAFAGTTRLPNIMNSSTKVTRAMMSAAIGSLPNSEDLVSTSRADWPPTFTGNGASIARTAPTRLSPFADNGSTDGITFRYVASAPLKRA